MLDPVHAIRSWGFETWDRRGLAWRGLGEPQHVVAMTEGLTAQTSADAVSAAYRKIFEGVTDGNDWLRLPESVRMSRVEPLGYGRAKFANVTGIAMFLAERHPGHLAGKPSTGGIQGGSIEWALQQYPGVGPYTAAMVALLLGEDGGPPVDANLRRIGERADREGDDVRWMTALFAACRPAHQRDGVPSNFGRAVKYELASHLMDLGKLVCTARKPKCGACPLHDWCAYGLDRPSLPGSEV
jgi:A/G-specific adenine glycosylase